MNLSNLNLEKAMMKCLKKSKMDIWFLLKLIKKCKFKKEQLESIIEVLTTELNEYCDICDNTGNLNSGNTDEQSVIRCKCNEKNN